ncbi:N-acetylmuramoyl-L-alanine amidase family protein [Feifania hominis]|uniref:N-acetylmuramoyl-L-alanine amidase n=1 Tax=Feifania hominis TaxID=2763660 RepID=A0A926HVC4_9FIRM|nr:N-acetylmuramoyl-L-alanine amidase [Feifania hominis]MBC8536840.1 N-acetylmuramoyl-L-alanine amidase [Feifania hominis]
MKLWLDPGHGTQTTYFDTGAVGPYGTRECDVALSVAEALRSQLALAGHEVKVTDQRNMVIADRCKQANAWGADLFLSLHCNAANGKARGATAFVRKSDSVSKEIAGSIMDSYLAATGITDRGVKVDVDALGKSLGVLRQTDMPALLLELDFIDNTQGELMLSSPLFVEVAAKAIYEGIEEAMTEKSRYYVKGGIHFVDIAPGKFHIKVWDAAKKTTKIRDYFNLGFFGILKGGATIPVGNLCADGEVITEASNQESWLSSHGRKMTTLCVFDDGTVKVMKTDTISGLKGLQSAVSGIPVVLGGEDVSWKNDCKPEGYTGGECYATWHGFLGSLRDGSLKYFAMKTKTGNCIQSSEVWNKIKGYGFDDVIMLDGGGSFVLDNGGRNVAVTSENRRIHSVGLY